MSDPMCKLQNFFYPVLAISNSIESLNYWCKAGVPFNITTHHGRHTYRALLDEADVVDPTVINKLMGWSNGNSMDSIYRQVTETRLLRTKEQFENFINNFKNNKS